MLLQVLREGMGQASNRPNSDRDVLDTVITNALIVDAVAGIVKADVGIKVGCTFNLLNVFFCHVYTCCSQCVDEM